MRGNSYLLLALCLCFVALLKATPVLEANDDVAQKVISALNNALNFYHRDFRSINLDGIFGLRVAQGAFLSILNDVQDGQLRLEDHILKQVKGLYNKASMIGQHSIPFLKKSAPEYFEKFKKQVSDPWLSFKPFTNKQLQKRIYDPQQKRHFVSFDEAQSDKCMAEITGTGASSNSSQPCQVSDECWRLISSEGAQGYTLTHQALFLQLGEVQGCTQVLLKRLEESNIEGGLEQIYNRICSDMYPEMTAMEQKGQSSMHRDLYMEQAMVCGSIGYRDFLSQGRLKQILSWQRKDGCFSEITYEAEDEENDNNYYKDEGDAQQNDFTAVEKNGNFPVKSSLMHENSKLLRKPLSVNKRTMRSLLVEKELNDGCLSHLAGVATGLLGLYLRWVLYPQSHVRQPIPKLEANNKLQDELYANRNLGGLISKQERQLHQLKQDFSQLGHLVQMRRTSMVDNGAEEALQKEESPGSFPWTVFFICVCSILLVLSVIFMKGTKRALNIVEATVANARKRTHII